MLDITTLLNELKKYRNELVARNYPYQQVSDIITKWEQHLTTEQDKDTDQAEWIEGYNKWKSNQ
jgi:hypothetical protein